MWIANELDTGEANETRWQVLIKTCTVLQI